MHTNKKTETTGKNKQKGRPHGPNSWPKCDHCGWIETGLTHVETNLPYEQIANSILYTYHLHAQLFMMQFGEEN